MTDFDAVDLESFGILKSAESYISCDVNEAVKLRMGNQGVAANKPITVPQFFNAAVEKYPKSAALIYENFDENNVSTSSWSTVTYEDYKITVQQVAKAFIKLGMEPKSGVCVLAFNCPEWFYSELATICGGGILSGIYTTNSAEAAYHILHSSNATICIVDNTAQMLKVRSIKERLPKLKAIIQIHGPYPEFVGVEEGYYKWSDIMDMDTANYDLELSKREQDIKANECCMLVFTSGTTGLPKGVMLSHDNVTWNCMLLHPLFEKLPPGESERVVSYLPLNHIAAQMIDVFFPISTGGEVYFADRNALKGTLGKTLVKARPTRFMGVPRVFEKIQEKFKSIESKNSRLMNKIVALFASTVKDYHLRVMRGESSSSCTYWFAEKMIRKVKVSLGLDQCRHVMIGAAPVSAELKLFFLQYDIKLLEVFGMSETSGQAAIADVLRNLETCGKPIPGVELKIYCPDKEGRGEICIRSRNIFMGYLENMESTVECIKTDGWFHTGDLGYVTMSGELGVSGRIKELIITAGGENIPPAHIENLVKEEVPGLSNVFLIGDKRKFLTVLVTVKTKTNSDTGKSTDDLLPESLAWIQSLGLEYKTVSEILQAGPCPRVLESIQEGINRANQNAISSAQKVQKFALLDHDFSIPTGELGPTLKVKRNVVEQIYKDEIEKLYTNL